MKCTLVKAGQMRSTGAPIKAKAGDAPPVEIQLLEDTAGGLTVFGTTAGGKQADLSSVATITATSSDPTTLEVGAVSGAHVAYAGKKPGTADLVLVATWNDGSIGPFQLTVHATMAQDPNNQITGIGVTLDSVVVS